MDRLPHAMTCCESALRDGLKDASRTVTACSEESEIGKANHRAKGHRWSTTAGEGGVMPVILQRWSVPTGEPCHTETVPHGSVGGRQKRSRKTTSLAAYPISFLAAASGSR